MDKLGTKVNISQSPSKSEKPTPTCSNKTDAVELWSRMASMYGHKWRSQHGVTMDETWMMVLSEIPAERFGRALKRCADEFAQWPPTLPEFVELTKVSPEEVGAPPEKKAWKDACHGAYPYNRWHKWSHKCVYHAAVKAGLSDICERGERVRREFAAEYASACARAHELPEPPSGVLEQKKPQRASKERSLAAIEEMEKIIRGEL